VQSLGSQDNNGQVGDCRANLPALMHNFIFRFISNCYRLLQRYAAVADAYFFVYFPRPLRRHFICHVG